MAFAFVEHAADERRQGHVGRELLGEQALALVGVAVGEAAADLG